MMSSEACGKSKQRKAVRRDALERYTASSAVSQALPLLAFQ